MKITAFLLLSVTLQVSAGGYAQKVTLSKNNAPLFKVIDEIQRQTGFNFVYTNGVLDKSVPVNIKVKKASLEEALKLCFKDQPLSYAIIENIVVVRPKRSLAERKNFLDYLYSMPPPQIIRGKVIDEKGTPMAGVSVQVKGTRVGTQTNADGEFTINTVQQKPVLIFSFVGYERQEVAVSGKLVIVTMKLASVTLQSTTITYSSGYQRISKERATGAYDVVGQEVLAKRPVSNLSTALQGAVAGLQAKENLDGSASFLIRGAGTFNTDPTRPLETAQPLIVVDGFAISGFDFNNINPNDVESITVLKDAAASSIWGSRGANGVIVVTTKKPKAGGMNVNAQVFTRISQMIDLDQVMNQANSANHVRYEKLAYDSNWTFNPYAGGFTEIGKSLTLAQEQLFAFKNGEITQAQLDAELAKLSAIDNRSQIRDLLMQRAILTQANLSFSSATDRAKTSASLMYENNKEGFKRRGYDRVVLNFNNTYNATRFLEVNFGVNIQYRKNDASGVGGGTIAGGITELNNILGGSNIAELQALSPYELLLNPDGSYGINLRDWNRAEMSKLPLDKFPYQDWSYNLLREIRGRERTTENISARVQAGVVVDIFKGLSFEGRAQYEKRKTDTSFYFSEDTYEARNMVNTYTEYNDATKAVGKMYVPKGGILRSRNSDYQSYTLRGQFNYDRIFAKSHQVTAIAGAELLDELYTARINPTLYGYFPDRNQSTVPPYGYGSSVNQLRTFRSTTAAAYFPVGEGNDGNTILNWRSNRLVSFYGNAGYTFDRKYTLTGSIRSDASNFITKNSSLRWSPLWSVGAMWNVTGERFTKSISWLNRLSARLTYGSNGLANQTVSTETLVNISTSPSTNTGTITGTVSTIGNPLLRWEKTYTTNLGFDFSMFKNKLFGKIDLYNRVGKDIVGNRTLSSVTGATSARYNNAGIYNRGIELELGTNVNITPSLTYNTSVTYAYNKNKITSLYFPALFVYDLLQGQYVEGRPVGSVYSYTYLGMQDGIPYVEGPDKTSQSFNDVALHNRGLGLPFLNYEGTNIPPHTLGWISNFGYKNFNLMVVIVGTMGGKFRMPVFDYATTIGSSKTSVDAFVSEVFAGTPGIPGFPRKDETQVYLWDRYAPNLSNLVESSSFIECKEVNLEYFLPKRLAGKISFNNIKLYTQVRNLGLIYTANSKGYHPQWLPGSNRPVTNYVFGLNLQF